jgi:hypothetical protein
MALPHAEIIAPQALIGIRGFHDELAAALSEEASWGFGKRELASTNHAPPRVITVPVGGNMAPGPQRSHRSQLNFGIRQPQLAFHIWGANETACEDLMVSISTVLDYKHQGFWRPISEDWQGLDDQWNSYCVLMIYLVQIMIPFASRECGTATIKTINFEEMTYGAT